MRIGLLGALVNNENMGCVALTYSLLSLLEEISHENNIVFEYYIFEMNRTKKIRKLCNKLNIPDIRIKIFDVTALFRVRRFLHHFSTGIQSLIALHNCNVVIDLTAGDSFSDIYGQYIFDSETNVKLLVERMRIPLILGPQTYGPFQTEKNIRKAKKAIEGASLVISRDQKSKDYISSFTEKKVYVTTDLAFILPFEKSQIKEQEKNKTIVKIGINVSGLLLSEKTEHTVLCQNLKTDYDLYIRKIIDWLLEMKIYEIHIIPHVGNDGCEWVWRIYGDRLHYYDAFETPIEAKNVIASMDLFIGSRMHATIGSFSAEVPTIAVAYSRKFSGLFEHLDYEYVVDLCNQETKQAFEDTKEYIINFRKLKEKLIYGLDISRKDTKRNKELIAEELMKYIRIRQGGVE